MENKTYQIKIESILGGQSPTTHFAASDQFKASLGINPGMSLNDTASTSIDSLPSGLIRPSPFELATGDTITAMPRWIIENPKDASHYVYDADGSVYSTSLAGTV